MHNLTVSNVHSHMIDAGTAGIKQQIPRLHLAGVHCMTLGCLGTGGTVHADACAVLHDITHETGTVHTGTRVIAACTVRSTHKLKSVIHEILAGIGCCFRCLGCRCLCCCQLFFQLLCCLDFRSRSIVLVSHLFCCHFEYSRNRSFLDDLRLCVCNHRFLPHQTA